MPTPKQQLIDKIINRVILHARRVGFVGIDGELRRQLNRTTLNNLITLWNDMEKKEQQNGDTEGQPQAVSQPQD